MRSSASLRVWVRRDPEPVSLRCEKDKQDAMRAQTAALTAVDRTCRSGFRLAGSESVQLELAVDRANFCRLDQARMRHDDRVQWAFELFQPKVQKLVQVRKTGAEIVILPDIGLEQPG